MNRLHDLGSSILIPFYSKMNFFQNVFFQDKFNCLLCKLNFPYENSNVNINFIDFNEKQDN